jgi:Zn finger protein HypA/HybF involved in hydrogenase expression
MLDREVVRAMLDQALAEARSREAHAITALHLVLYDASPETERALRHAVDELSVSTSAENARIVVRRAPSNFICWNCCGLRFQSDDPNAICPNCGESGLLLPPDVIFALECIEVVS